MEVATFSHTKLKNCIKNWKFKPSLHQNKDMGFY